MNEGKISAPRDIVEDVTSDNCNLVWAYIDWALKAGRFGLSSEAADEFHKIPREFMGNSAALASLNGWMDCHLKRSVRRHVFSDIRRAQFEAAKGAVQITIAEETRKLLRERKTALFGEGRGSMEVTIRHLLDAETRSLPLQAYRLLKAFQQRSGLPSMNDAVRVLVDHLELTSQTLATQAKPLRQEIAQLLHELKE